MQELVHHLWTRWIKEWLPGLSRRLKLCKDVKDIKEGGVVLVMMPDCPRAKWPIGRILEVNSLLVLQNFTIARKAATIF